MTTTHAGHAADAVRMLGITKRFGALTACDRVDFTVAPGEVHCLLGENGAGKTTLMSILFGLVRPDDGQVLVGGAPAEIDSPRRALELGIGMVHQHFMLVPDFTVAENVVLGSRPSWRPRFDARAVQAEVAAVAERAGLSIDPAARIRDLPVDVQQRVEILKLLYRGARVLILDEPTASLGPAGIASLFDALRELRAAGHSAVLITHKLSEVTQIADRVTVIRAGALQGVFARGAYDEADLARAMTGGELHALPSRRPARAGAPALRVRGLRVDDTLGRTAVEDLDLDVRAGEIVGIAGVEGNGQRELADALAGVGDVRAGSIVLGDRDLTAAPPRERQAAGMAVIPEDRLHWGLVADLTLAENLALAEVAAGRMRRHGLLDRRLMGRRGAELLASFGVRPPDPRALASQLSGGNQQKVVIAREMSREPRLLVAAQPTRGLDVGAIEYVHRKLIELRDRGGAIVLVTNELEELMALSDRVAVMYRGRFVYRSPVADASAQAIASAMAGIRPDAPAAPAPAEVA
jgi:simple sugar transport system ATP-binding protein